MHKLLHVISSKTVFDILSLRIPFHNEYLQMGARSDVQNELLCRFVFPERPGALMKFLDAFSPSWNITLFHYRGQVYIMSFCGCCWR